MTLNRPYSPENYFQNLQGIKAYDYLENTYDDSGKLLRTIFKRGGSSGKSVNSLYYYYDSNGNLVNSSVFEGEFDTDAVNYITAVETADGKTLENDVKSVINSFVLNCKTCGIWDAIKASCIMAGARTLSGALIPLKGSAPTNYNFVNGDYSRVVGLKGDGTSKYLDSNRNNNADPQDDFHYSVFTTNIESYKFLISSSAWEPGVSEIETNPGMLTFRNRSQGNFFKYGSPNTMFAGSSRNSSSFFLARSNKTTQNFASTSQTPSSRNFTLFVRRSVHTYTSSTISFYSIGESLDLAKLDDSISRLMYELGEIFAFRMTIKTDNFGTSNNDQFTLATRSGYTYNYTIDWGDGTIESYNVDTQPTHTYSSIGEYQIKIKGVFPTLYYNNGGDVDKIISIENIGSNGWTTLERGFFGANNIVSFEGVGDTSGVTNFRQAWSGCSSLISFPLLDTSSGTDFYYAWNSCSSLTSFPLLDTSSGANFFYAWFGCSGLISFPLLDTSSGIDFTGAWFGCSGLISFPLLDTSSGTNFNEAWRGCSSLTTFPLIDMSKVTNFQRSWDNCSGLTSFPLLDTSSGTRFLGTWTSCNSLTSFPLLNTSSGTIFREAWLNCSSLTSFPLLDTSNGTSFSSAWFGCSGLTSFPLLDTSNGTDFSYAWYGCSSLISFPLLDTSNGTNFAFTWYGCSSLTSFPLIDTSNGTNFQSAWRNCSSLTNFPANFFDSWNGTPVANCFLNTWDGCTSLTAQSVENILVSIDTSGQSAPASGTNIDIDYNVATGSLSTAATTAITNLKAKGWTPTINGVAQ